MSSEGRRQWRRKPYALVGLAAAMLLACGAAITVPVLLDTRPAATFSVLERRTVLQIDGLVALLVLAVALSGAILLWRAIAAERRMLRREVEQHRAAEQRLAATRDDLERRLNAGAAELAQATQDLRAEISERNRFEMTLRASEERYRELFDSANDLVYEHDLEGRFLAINKAAQRITGYAQQQALGLNIEQLVPPEDVDRMREMIARQLAGEPASTFEVTLITKGGARVALELSTHLVFHAGVPVAVQGIARDVTERRRLEEQLRHSQKMEAIGRLAGGLAHDFNNLLTVIGAYSQMMLDETKGSSELEMYANEVISATERAGALTARLLTFSRRQFMQPQVIDLNQLLLSMENMLQRLLGEDIELRITLSETIDAIRADPGQIEQVVMNLAVNARDAMPHGGRLSVSTSEVQFTQTAPAALEPGRYVKLAVSDTGLGMSSELMSRIFEPFFTTKGPGKGTGLGLSTVYGIVKQTGGEILVESEPGEGSTFTIYLRALAAQVRVERIEPPPPEALAATRERATVLLIEDEPGVRRLVCRMLADRGYRVIEAAGGEDALSIFEQHRPLVDLVVTDLVMPSMSGVEVARRLSLLRPGIKILYMTGYSEDIIFERGATAELAPVLRKPFVAEALDRKIRELLDGKA